MAMAEGKPGGATRACTLLPLRRRHWVQIEYRERFHRLVSDFLGEGQW
jgi:hypothetical protein